MHSGPECLRCRATAQERPVDPVLNLREARRRSGLTQTEVARLSGVGAKTISSFETGDRISSIKLFQLTKLLRIYGMTLGEFFRWSPDDEVPIEPDGDDRV